MMTIGLFGAEIIIGAVLIISIWFLMSRPALLAEPRARLLAVFAFFLLPLLVTWAGFSTHMEGAKSTSFCLSCHIMSPYGRSLYFDSPAYLPAAHFQNRRIPRDEACFTCHTTYAMYGDLRAKLRGFRHLMVQITGPPDKIELYEPYQNRECLHCHDGARSFVESEMHAGALEQLRSNEVSCLVCHSQVHHPSGDEPAQWKPNGGADE